MIARLEALPCAPRRAGQPARRSLCRTALGARPASGRCLDRPGRLGVLEPRPEAFESASVKVSSPSSRESSRTAASVALLDSPAWNVACWSSPCSPRRPGRCRRGSCSRRSPAPLPCGSGSRRRPRPRWLPPRHERPPRSSPLGPSPSPPAQVRGTRSSRSGWTVPAGRRWRATSSGGSCVRSSRQSASGRWTCSPRRARTRLSPRGSRIRGIGGTVR